MKLRYQLLLWIGTIFFIAFGLSLYFEVSLTDRHLRIAEKNLRNQILEIYEQNRKRTEEFLKGGLGEGEALIDALLLRIARDKTIFAWTRLGAIFQNNNWIDFAQTTDDKNALLGLLIPLNIPMKQAREERIDDLISWIVVEGHPAYLGIDLPNKTEDRMKLILLPQMLQTMQPTGLASLDRAIAYAKEPHALPLWKESSKGKEGCLQQEIVTSRMVEYLQRFDQAEMVDELTSIFPSPLFGDTPLSRQAPAGIARFTDGMGNALFSAEIFYPEALFQPQTQAAQNQSRPECLGIGKGLKVIAPKGMDRVFIANTFTPGKGELVIGMDIEQMVKALILTLNQSILLVHDGKQIGGFTATGEKLGPFPFVASMLQNKSGLVNWQNTPYFYSHLQPFSDLDLHFFILNPEKTAFAFVNALEEGTHTIINKLSWNMRIIALAALVFVIILLNIFSRRITRPITQLADATEEVVKGKLEGIQLPKVHAGQHDEVGILVDSFGRMITGLQEKEKVKGVLNKVVSQEIAQAILKGEVHLGGEERKVTVLFADIRHFTEMSTQMAPHEVIAMLNSCMTKISHVIDEHGGVIDKYVGDEVMALFGAPIDHGDSALKAIECALEIVATLKAWNVERAQKGYPKIEMGIGIHTGLVLVGNMGAENRLNYTVIGRNVNLAARLCSSAAGMQILITQDTLSEPDVKEHIDVNELPATELKGFAEKIPLFEVIGQKPRMGV